MNNQWKVIPTSTMATHFRLIEASADNDEAWEDYLYWQTYDKKTLKRLNNLIKDTQRSPYEIGKPEPLKNELSGWLSRRIDDCNRLVYKEKDGNIIIASCKGHYED